MKKWSQIHFHSPLLYGVPTTPKIIGLKLERLIFDIEYF